MLQSVLKNLLKQSVIDLEDYLRLEVAGAVSNKLVISTFRI